jgi:thiamine biosynthesis lipoprotein
MYADAWATALLVLGYEEGRALANREGLAVLWIEESPSGEFEEHMSPAFKAYMVKQSLQKTAI